MKSSFSSEKIKQPSDRSENNDTKEWLRQIFLAVPLEEFTEQTNVYSCGEFHFPLLLVPPDVLLSEKYS